jgi:putative aldouronate transport system substrate-binding protein
MRKIFLSKASPLAALRAERGKHPKTITFWKLHILFFKEKKMRKFVKFVLSVTVMLFITLVISCGKPGNARGGRTAETSEMVDYSVHETFTFWQLADQNDYYATYSENPVVWYLNNKYNVTLEYQHPAIGSEAEALSLMFGTGEYTDMIDMSAYTGSISALYEEGVLANIAEYLDYMPNLKKLIDSDENIRRVCYNDNGQILTLRMFDTDEEYIWGGLVYRRDILETVTDGNIQFPSGSDIPTTIADWEYMLPLFKNYFEAAGMKEYAPFIIPSSGVFGFGELINGFGASSQYYVEGGIVKYGPMEEGFYNYLKKMKEWYEKGYIYKDFAGRTNDPFYFPNPALTYGGVTGVWYGLQAQLGNVMSMPDYGLYFDVQPISSPLDTEHGITEAAPFSRVKYYALDAQGFAVTRACKNIPKLLSIMDFMYSSEGAMTFLGLTKEQGADTNPIYVKAGLQDGAYWFEGDKIICNPLLTRGGGTINHDYFVSNRLPGLRNYDYQEEITTPIYLVADRCWGAYPEARQEKLPSALYRTAEEDKTYAANNAMIQEYVSSSAPKFIMGIQPINDQAWADFQTRLVALGIVENLRIQQAAYDRYLRR